MANILAKRMLFFFANWLKLGRDAALVFCDIFKTLVECLTYVAAGAPKKVAVQKVKPSAKTQGFPLFSKLQNYPQQVLSTFYPFSLQHILYQYVIKAQWSLYTSQKRWNFGKGGYILQKKQCQTVHTLTCPQKSATFVFPKWEEGRHRKFIRCRDHIRKYMVCMVWNIVKIRGDVINAGRRQPNKGR